MKIRDFFTKNNGNIESAEGEKRLQEPSKRSSVKRYFYFKNAKFRSQGNPVDESKEYIYLAEGRSYRGYDEYYFFDKAFMSVNDPKVEDYLYVVDERSYFFSRISDCEMGDEFQFKEGKVETIKQQSIFDNARTMDKVIEKAKHQCQGKEERVNFDDLYANTFFLIIDGISEQFSKYYDYAIEMFYDRVNDKTIIMRQVRDDMIEDMSNNEISLSQFIDKWEEWANRNAKTFDLLNEDSVLIRGTKNKTKEDFRNKDDCCCYCNRLQ